VASPMKGLERDSLESLLNEAILKFSQTDFLLSDFDIHDLALESFGAYYSVHAVFWIGSELIAGREAAWKRLGQFIEPMHTILEMGMATIESLQVEATRVDSEGNSISVWKLKFGGPYSTAEHVCWRTRRSWKDGVVIAELIEAFPSS
jgi:hypothetical protein